MDDFNIIFVESAFSEEFVLGRRAREYVEREFGKRQVAKDLPAAREKYEDGAVNVALPLNMPLARMEDISRVAAMMRRRGFCSLRLGDRGGDGEICFSKGCAEEIFVCDEAFFKIDSAKSFNMVYNHLRRRILDRLLDEGAFIPDASTVHIDDTVLIEAGAKILPFSRIEGGAVVRDGASVYASFVTGGEISKGASVESSRLQNSFVGEGATVGPFARLRDAKVCAGVRVGDFVEVKASVLHDGVKAAHLAYVGDAEVGARTNIGCGAVFCNYDGKDKHRASVGEDCFLGANCNLVAPVKVGDDCFVAAGTTLGKDVPDGSFVIARPQTKVKANEFARSD